MLPGKDNKSNSDDIDNENDNNYTVKNSRHDDNNNDAYNNHAGKNQSKHLSRNNATLRQ